MTLRQLEILRAILRFQTTMAAARALGMSQPAVSNAVKHMESQLGFALFERVNNRLFPTDAARQLQEEAEPLFAIQAALTERVQDLRDEKFSRLRLLATPPLGHGVIPRTMGTFLLRRPRLRVVFDVRDLNDVVEGVESGAAELGFGLNLGTHPALEGEALHQGRMVCVCRRGEPLAKRKMVTPADLAGQRFIALDPRTRMGHAVREAFRDAGAPYNFALEVHTCHIACLMVAAGLGVSVVDPFSAITSVREELVEIPFEPAIPSIAHAFWSKRRPPGEMVRQFVHAVRQSLAKR